MPLRDLLRPRRTNSTPPSCSTSTAAAYARSHRLPPPRAPSGIPPAYIDPPSYASIARRERDAGHVCPPQHSDFAAGLVSGVLGTLLLLWMLGWLGREGECSALRAGLGDLYARLGELRGILEGELGGAQEVVGDVLRRDALAHK